MELLIRYVEVFEHLPSWDVLLLECYRVFEVLDYLFFCLQGVRFDAWLLV
jgi:hypothetical protein